MSTNNVLACDASSVFWFLAKKDFARDSFFVAARNNLRMWRKAKGLSTVDLGKALGITGPSVSRIENHLQQPRTELLQKICAYFGVNPSGFYEEVPDVEPIKLEERPIPLLTYVQASMWSEDSLNLRHDEVIRHITASVEYSAEAFAMRIHGNSMEPRFHDGDVIIVDPTIQPKPGNFVVAKEATSTEATFRRYRPKGLNDAGLSYYVLEPLNENYDPLRSDLQSIRIIGTMVEHRTYQDF